jgi:cellulose 1,4-beta-cellobiosidase
MGDTSFYGPGLTVDTSKVFTVVTQFIGDPLTEIKRYYVQSGKYVESLSLSFHYHWQAPFFARTRSRYTRLTSCSSRVIPNSQSTIANVTGNSITTEFCDAQKAAFGDNYTFKTHGGMASMSSALKGGMTLVMSVWDDHYANMLWLDSTYPTTKTGPGGPRGTCAVTSGVPADVESKSPGASVTYSNIKVGPINSTFTQSS